MLIFYREKKKSYFYIINYIYLNWIYIISKKKNNVILGLWMTLTSTE